MRTQIVAVLTIIIVIVATISAYYFLESNSHESSPSKASPLELNLAPSGILNTTQGGVTSVNVTLTSLNMSETSIPLSLVLQTYDNKPVDSSSDKEDLFSSTFSVNPIVLKTNETETSVLTLHVAEDVPIGKYAFLVELGNTQIHNVLSATLEVTVAAP